MKLTRCFVCGLVVLLGFSAARGAEPAGSEPGQVALEFINAHVAAPGGYEEVIARVEANPNVTERFKQALAKLYRDALKQDPELGYGADAVISGQDSPDRFRVKSRRIHGGRARVVLIGAEPPNFPMEVKVDLVREDGRWLIDSSGDLVRD